MFKQLFQIWKILPHIEDKDAEITFLSNLSRHTNTVNCVRFSPDGLTLASAGDGMYYLYIPYVLFVHSLCTICTFPMHYLYIPYVLFLHSLCSLCTCSYLTLCYYYRLCSDGALFLWAEKEKKDVDISEEKVFGSTNEETEPNKEHWVAYKMLRLVPKFLLIS